MRKRKSRKRVSERLIFSQISAIKKSIQDVSARVELVKMPVNPLNQKINSTMSREDEDFYTSESDRQALIIK